MKKAEIIAKAERDKKPKKKCKNCGQKFTELRSWQKYCSKKCNNEAYWKVHTYTITPCYHTSNLEAPLLAPIAETPQQKLITSLQLVCKLINEIPNKETPLLDQLRSAAHRVIELCLIESSLPS